LLTTQKNKKELLLDIENNSQQYNKKSGEEIFYLSHTDVDEEIPKPARKTSPSRLRLYNVLKR
jgi:hypothetical protein